MRNILRFALVLCLTLLDTGAYAAKKKKEKDPFEASTGGLVFYSTRAEVNMGKDVKAEVLKQYKLYENPELVNYVRQIGAKLASYADRQNVTYEFFVLDDPLINAFALPGGAIYITRGILTVFNNEAELAGVLGHEITHVVERHSMKQLQGQQATGLLLQVLAKGQEVPLWQQIGADLMVFKPYGRGDETKSDAVGLKYAYEAGYKADEVAHMFEELQKRDGSHMPAFLRSHPVDAQRIKQIRELFALIQTRGDIKPGASPLQTNADEYAKIVYPHTYRALYPEIQASFEEMAAAVTRKDLDGVMKSIDKDFKSKWLNADRETIRKYYENKFASADKISATVAISEYRFLDKDYISVLCTVSESRTLKDGKTENESTQEVAFFKKNSDKDASPKWRLAKLESFGSW